MATIQHSTSRRAVIAALAGTPFLAGTMAAAIAAPIKATERDGALLAAWEEYKRLQRLNYSTPGDGWDDEQEVEFYRQLDAAEIVIERAEAKSPKGAAVQVLLAIMHNEEERSVCEAIINGATMPASYGDLDWTTKLAFRAVAALHTMEG